MEDNFEFLKRCLDVETLSYLKNGLGLEDLSDDDSTQSVVLSEICNTLGIKTLDDAKYQASILNAFLPYKEILQHSLEIECNSYKKRIKKFLNYFLNSISYDEERNSYYVPFSYCEYRQDLFLNIDSINTIFSSLYEWTIGSTNMVIDLSNVIVSNSKQWYPYFFLKLLVPTYPEWMLQQTFPHILNFDSSKEENDFVNSLPNKWASNLNRVFNDSKEREAFRKLLFLISFFEVLRWEEELIDNFKSLELPISLPLNETSSFIISKLDALPKDTLSANCAAVIMGIYAKSGLRSEEVDRLMEKQKAGEGELVSIHPVHFTYWQAKRIIKQHPPSDLEGYSLDPLFAIISSLKYPDPSKWSKIYFEFKDYAKEDLLRLQNKYSGTLYLNHFFPFHDIDTNDVFMLEGEMKPEITPDGATTGRLLYQPLTKSGICIGLIDKIYLTLSGLDKSALRLLSDSDISAFSFVQFEDIIDNINDDDKVVISAPYQLYHKYLSDIGSWRIVKDKFNAELEKRVKTAVADMRHNIKHYIDHLPRQTKKIEEFLITPDLDKTQRMTVYAHDIHKNIKIALRVLNYSLSGLESSHSDTMKWNETILQLLDEMPNLNTRISIEYHKGNVDDEILFPFREKGFYFAQMVQNIIKNAEDHGFKDGNIPNPKISIVSSLDAEFLYLSFMNNGTPLSKGMTIDIYRTRGLSSKTGNSGLGGAQIDRIIRAHGGKICELRSSEKWNFILTIKFKRNEA